MLLSSLTIVRFPVCLANGEFKVGLTNQGDFVLQRSNGDTIWSAGTAPNGHRLFVQSDGNVIVRRSNNQAIWTSQTYDHSGAQLVVDDGGRIAVAEGNLAIWLEGIPRGTYTGRPAKNLQFPVRGMFYYPVRIESCSSVDHDVGFDTRLTQSSS